MTPPPAAGHAGTLPRRATVPARPRRTSGPAPRPKHGRDVRAGTETSPAAPLALRVVAGARAVPDARWLDRLIKGNGWIALIGALLIGLVFLQVSLLQLNTGIGRAVETAGTLEQQNTQLQAEVSRLQAGERVEDIAAGLGLVTPAAGKVVYLDARRANGTKAARSVTRPQPVAQQPVAPTAAQDAGVLTPQGTSAGAADQAQASAPAAETPATPATPTPTPTQTPAQAEPAAGAGATATAAPQQQQQLAAHPTATGGAAAGPGQ